MISRLTYDMHIHSCLSPCGDDDNTPENIVGMAYISGLDAISVTDHNSCLNLPAVIAAAEKYPVIVVPGMELTTSEDVHVLCYFRTLKAAMLFSAYVTEHSINIKNRPEIFGNQLIYGADDLRIGEEKRLLIAASTISFDDVYDLLLQFNGIMVPAHINKSSTSLISNLGFLPKNSKFTAAEIQDAGSIPALQEKYPYLKKCHILSSSDAHMLKDIQDPDRVIHVKEKSVNGIIDALSSYLDGGIQSGY